LNIYLDIETLPGQSDLLMNSLLADAAKEKEGVRAPSNYKDEAKIAEYIAARHAEIDASMEDKRLKTSFDGMFGSIACIAYAFDDEQVVSVNAMTTGGEAAMLEGFYAHIACYTSAEYHGGSASVDATFIGHNIADFDLTFLKHRSIILDVRPPPVLAKAMAAKPWDKCIADTMLMWSPSREKRVGLDKLCRALGVPCKGDFDGSMVAETWPVDPQKVIDYCKGDVERVRAVYRRMTFA
jgi:hypothetical protein